MNPAIVKELTDLFGRAWSALGPLIGVLVGSWLTTKGQRKQWFLDNKRAEYRKVLTTLSACATRFVSIYGVGPTAVSGAEERKLARAAEDSGNVIYNRLFIAHEMSKLNIMDRWTKTVYALRERRDVETFTTGLNGIMEDIRTAALRDFS